jgi:hypothetical protein
MMPIYWGLRAWRFIQKIKKLIFVTTQVYAIFIRVLKCFQQFYFYKTYGKMLLWAGEYERRNSAGLRKQGRRPGKIRCGSGGKALI